MKYVISLFIMVYSGVLVADVTAAIKSVEALQRYPWNGMVDIVVTMEGVFDDVANAEYSFVATNSENKTSVPVKSIVQNGNDTGSGTIWTRRFVWDAANDAGAVKIDDLALTVDARVTDGVQLWENGPYWAKCNVGATKQEEYGYYFWWGDTVGYKRNAANNGWVSVKDGAPFKFNEENCPTYFGDKLLSSGYIDSTGNLVAAHDAATSYLGAPWRMPTDVEFSSLIDNCDTTWTVCNDVWGRLVRGRGAYATKSIFLPAAGNVQGDYALNTGSYGLYWSSTPLSDGSICAWSLDTGTGCHALGSNSRSYGQSVRPLRGFASGMIPAMHTGMVVHLKLDCRTGSRTYSSDGEVLLYDASWYENGSEVRITENGTVITTGIVGSYTWRPEASCISQHELKLEVMSAGRVVGTESVQFINKPDFEHTPVISKPAVAPTSVKPGVTAEIRCSRCGEIMQAATGIPALGYIRNVTAQQLWPHNKVSLEFTVADDIGVIDAPVLSVWCARGNVTNVATRILGDWSVRPGVHRTVWDMEADGLRFANDKTIFGVSVKKLGVQLWENGPYWAECNVGASAPEEYGYYFRWGDVVGYERNVKNDGWISEKDGAELMFSSSPTSYKNNSQLQTTGYIDSSGNLVPAYDAATVHLGTPWRMPTYAEVCALINNCDTAWVVRNGVAGRLVTGRGAYALKCIFLPAAGYGSASNLLDAGFYGRYWSSTPNSDNSRYAWYLGFDSSSFYKTSLGRYGGRSVRPIREFSEAGSKQIELTYTVSVTETAVDTTLGDGVAVFGESTLGFAPADSVEVSLQIDGATVLSATDTGAFNWQPQTKGEHTLTHIAGTNVWTRTVNVTALVYEEPTPNPGREPDANFKLSTTVRSLTSSAKASGTIGTTKEDPSYTGTWTATTSVDWLTLTYTTRNVGLPVIYTAAENVGVEERTGYIYVSGHVFTVTQPGVGGSLDSEAAEFDATGGEGTFTVTVGAQASWRAMSNVDWISVETVCGTGETEVVYHVAPWNNVSTRSGTITAAGCTFTVNQTGRPMKLNETKVAKDYLAHDIVLTVDALASTDWGIALDAPWVSIVDRGSGNGGGTVTLAINENPSYVSRTATALIGTETLMIVQTGRSTAALAFAISPEATTASVKGANGVIAVEATPDLPWTATSQANWLTIMPGFSAAAGNGNVVYAATPNPTMAERSGTIRVTPDSPLR